jgi:diphosphomevalonate decarboxylase
MPTLTATALAHPNIALIKYWGNCDNALRLPANGSISMNLKGLETRTRVHFDSRLNQDSLVLNGSQVRGESLHRISRFLDLVRAKAGLAYFARVESENNFPMGAGLASSAAAFAALSLAATHALSLDFKENELSRLARRGSGSACRSIPTGFVEWYAGNNDVDSYAVSIAPPEYWDLTDCIAIVESNPKKIGSTQGHALADSSPLQVARVAGAPGRLESCRQAVLKRDFPALASIVEYDSNLMHAVMITSNPSLFYWQPSSLHLIKSVPIWRKDGLPVCYTLDAGPNVHLICPTEAAPEVIAHLKTLSGVDEIIITGAGSGASLLKEDTLLPDQTGKL